MNDELIAAIKDRISLGWSKEKIESEVLASGHTTEAFETAYDAALRPASVVQPAKVFGLKEVISKTSDLFIKNWRLGLSGLLAMLLVLAIGGGALFGLMVGQFVAGPNWFGILAVLVIAILGIFATTAIGLAVLRGLLKRFDGETFSIHLRLALGSVMPVLVVSFYSGVLTQIGYSIFFIPGLILAVFLSFVVPGVLLGETKGLRSLTYSAELVRGRFFRVLLAYVANAVLIMVAVLLVMALLALGSIEPMTLVLSLPLSLVGFVAVGWWQVCFMVALFELLKAEPNNKNLPFGERFWRYFATAVIAVVTFLLAVFVFLLSFGLTELSDLENMGAVNMDRNDGGMMQDIVRKQFLQSAVREAEERAGEAGDYTDTCGVVSLPAEATCYADASGFAFAVPVSDGYYCVDREGAETSVVPIPEGATTCR